MPRTVHTITTFQALTLLADKYRTDDNHQGRYRQIMSLYLLGPQKEGDNEVLNKLLSDSALVNYRVKSNRSDPVRREFECELARHMLEESLDVLSKDILCNHMLSIVYGQIPPDNDQDSLASGQTTPAEDSLLEHSLRASRAFFVSGQHDGAGLFDLFTQPTTIPISAIPGQFLIQLGIVAELIRGNQCVFHENHTNPVQLKYFLCALIAYDLFKRDKYALDNFACVLQMQEVKTVFQAIYPGFIESINLDELFRLHNAQAFDKAVLHAIKINTEHVANKRNFLALSLPHRCVQYGFFATDKAITAPVMRYVDWFREHEGYSPYNSTLKLSSFVLLMFVLMTTLATGTKMKKHAQTEIKPDITLSTLFSFSMCLGILTESLFYSLAEELARRNLLGGMH